MNNFNKGSALKLFLGATMTIVAFSASQGIAKELETTTLIAAHGGGGGHGGGDFRGGGGNFEGNRDFQHDVNHDVNRDINRDINREGSFVSPYNNTEYYYDDPDLPDAVDTPPDNYYENGPEGGENVEFNEFPS